MLRATETGTARTAGALLGTAVGRALVVVVMVAEETHDVGLNVVVWCGVTDKVGKYET
jgi:hypothetical protein